MTNIKQGGTSIKQGGVHIKQGGAYIKQGDDIIKQGGFHIRQGGAYIKQQLQISTGCDHLWATIKLNLDLRISKHHYQSVIEISLPCGTSFDEDNKAPPIKTKMWIP